MKRIYFSLLFVFFICNVVFAEEPICSTGERTNQQRGDSIIEESEYDIDIALKTIEFLDNDMVDRIHDYEVATLKKIKSGNIPKEVSVDLMTVTHKEWFYLSYPNSLSIIKGALLKYRVLYLKEKAKNLATKEAKEEYEKEKDAFCKFVSKTQYVE